MSLYDETLFYSKDIKLDFSDVLVVPQTSHVNSRKNVDLLVSYPSMGFTGIPVVASNISTIGTLTMARVMGSNKMLTSLHKFIPAQQLIDFYTNEPESVYAIYGMGIKIIDYEKFEYVYNAIEKVVNKPRYVMIEVANGYIDDMVEFVKWFHASFPEITIFAGSVCTPEGVRLLSKAGADIIRVGIGSGGPCVTRIQTGIGYPQLSAVIECSHTATQCGTKILSDGGCQNTGDIVKAFVGGASFVMIGSLLAGHDECDHIESNGKVLFYGMSSHHAQEKHHHGKRDYRGSEGREVWIDRKGPIQPTLDEIKAGLRSACTYIGSHNLNGLHWNAQFIKVNNQYNRILEK